MIVTAPDLNPPVSITKELNIVRKDYSVLLQTDKPVYKPGDLVRFRAFAVESETLPVDLFEMNVQVSDPDGNVVKLWHNVCVHAGLYEGSFQLADSVKLGMWLLKMDDELNVGLGDAWTSVQPY